MRSIRKWAHCIGPVGVVLIFTGCSIIPQARPLAIDMARTQFAHIHSYLDADAQDAPRGRFVAFVESGGFHIDWLFLDMSDEELHAVRWDGRPAVADAREDSTTGTVTVVQRPSAYTGGGLMGNNYTVSACWSFTVDLENHTVDHISDVECPTNIDWMLNGVDEKLSVTELKG